MLLAVEACFLLSVTSLGFLLLMSQRTTVCLGQASSIQHGCSFENDVDDYTGELCVIQMIDDIKYRQNSRPEGNYHVIST